MAPEERTLNATITLGAAAGRTPARVAPRPWRRVRWLSACLAATGHPSAAGQAATIQHAAATVDRSANLLVAALPAQYAAPYLQITSADVAI